MDVVLALLLVLVPIAAIVTITVIMIRRSLKRRARERAEGTFRNPFLLTAFGWVVAIIGGFFLLISLTTLANRSVAAGGSSPDGGLIAAAVMLVVGAVWAFVYGRRRITVWGERVDYQPFFAGRRTIWAMDAVRAETASNGKVTTFYIKGRDGRAASWYRSIFPPRTVAAFEHGVHHNAVASDTRRMPLGGMVPFTVDESLETPDRATATWHRDRTVQLDVLVSTPSVDLLTTVENELATTFTSLPPATGSAPFAGASSTSAGQGVTIEGARIEWRRRFGTAAIDARILAGGENGLDDARRAYGWFKTQLINTAKQHANAGSRQRRHLDGAFTVTYRETWT